MKKRFIIVTITGLIILLVSIIYISLWKKQEEIDLRKIKDDNTWVIIINNEKINVESFEIYYKFFIKLFALESGIEENKMYLKDQNKMKKLALEKYIENELIFNKAVEDDFFKTDQGKSLIRNTYKESLGQFFLFEKVFSKVNTESISLKDLEKFYKTLSKEYGKKGVKQLKSQGISYVKNGDNTKLKNFYKKSMFNKNMKKVQNQMVLESSIKKIKRYLIDI